MPSQWSILNRARNEFRSIWIMMIRDFYSHFQNLTVFCLWTLNDFYDRNFWNKRNKLRTTTPNRIQSIMCWMNDGNGEYTWFYTHLLTNKSSMSAWIVFCGTPWDHWHHGMMIHVQEWNLSLFFAQHEKHGIQKFGNFGQEIKVHATCFLFIWGILPMREKKPFLEFRTFHIRMGRAVCFTRSINISARFECSEEFIVRFDHEWLLDFQATSSAQAYYHMI